MGRRGVGGAGALATAAALAKKAGIASAYLSQIETGKREGTVETYRKLASALGITLDDLIG